MRFVRILGKALAESVFKLHDNFVEHGNLLGKFPVSKLEDSMLNFDLIIKNIMDSVCLVDCLSNYSGFIYTYSM